MSKELVQIVNEYQPPYQQLSCSVKEMAADFGISLRQAYALVHTPGFPCTKAGHSIRISKVELPVWLGQKLAEYVIEQTSDLIEEELNEWITEQSPNWTFQSRTQIEAQVYEHGRVLGKTMMDYLGITQMDKKMIIKICV